MKKLIFLSLSLLSVSLYADSDDSLVKAAKDALVNSNNRNLTSFEYDNNSYVIHCDDSKEKFFSNMPKVISFKDSKGTCEIRGFSSSEISPLQQQASDALKQVAQQSKSQTASGATFGIPSEDGQGSDFFIVKCFGANDFRFGDPSEGSIANSKFSNPTIPTKMTGAANSCYIYKANMVDVDLDSSFINSSFKMSQDLLESSKDFGGQIVTTCSALFPGNNYVILGSYKNPNNNSNNSQLIGGRGPNCVIWLKIA